MKKEIIAVYLLTIVFVIFKVSSTNAEPIEAAKPKIILDKDSVSDKLEGPCCPGGYSEQLNAVSEQNPPDNVETIKAVMPKNILDKDSVSDKLEGPCCPGGYSVQTQEIK
jgi:hypothetical protein